MKIYKNTSISNIHKGSAIAIGNFDGIHYGHQRVFHKAKNFAKKNKIKFGVLTFNPLPVMFFNKKINNFRLVNEDVKFRLFKKYKVDFVINLKFNKNFSKIKAKDFITNILYKKINPRFIFVSNNFRFGNKRKGNLKLLSNFSKIYKYQLVKVDPLRFKGKIISSTRIRKCLSYGHINLANKLLSRTWFVDSRVIKGKKLGRKLGYRTCNLKIRDYVLPKEGIYSVRVMVDNKKKILKGVGYLGSRPTFEGKAVFLEINIFDINRNLYKKKLRVYFTKFIRRDKKFKNSAKLIEQMNKDVIFAKKGLKAKIVL